MKHPATSLSGSLSALLVVSGCGMTTQPRTPVVESSAFRKSVIHEPRVAFVGDQMTYHWVVDEQSAHPLWLNYGTPEGAPWETSGEMLARFPAALSQRPDVVNIIVGAGDMVTDGWTMPCGPSDIPQIATCTNLEDMIAQAVKAGAYVIVGTTPYPEGTGDGPGAGVGEYNEIVLTAIGDPEPDALADYEHAVQQSSWTGSQPGTVTNIGDPVVANALGESILTQTALAAIQECECGGAK